MSWRTVVISNSAKLDYQMGFLVVRQEEVKKIHISEIGMLLIESTAVSVTAALLAELTEKKIKVIFCDKKRNPSSELIPYYGAHDTSLKVKNQIEWSKLIKDTVWTRIVLKKIENQMKLLKKYGKKESSFLERYLSEVEFADSTNREGHAAKVYFNAIFGMDFSRSTDCLINSALNYGYSILLSCFTREIVSNGYITQLGLFHDNMFNQFNFASDLMEPFRPLIDECVLSMRMEAFEHAEKMKLVNVLNNEVRINGRNEFVSNAVKIYCKSIFDALNDEDVSIIKFFEYEL